MRLSEATTQPNNRPYSVDVDDSTLFTKEDINRILRGLGSNNIDSVLYGIDLDRSSNVGGGGGMTQEVQEMQQHLRSITQRLDNVLEENAELRSTLQEIKTLLATR